MHLRSGSNLKFINCLQFRHEVCSCCRPAVLHLWAIRCPQWSQTWPCLVFPVRRRCLVGWSEPRWGKPALTRRPTAVLEGSEDGLDMFLSLQVIKGDWLTGDCRHGSNLETKPAVKRILGVKRKMEVWEMHAFVAKYSGNGGINEALLD